MSFVGLKIRLEELEAKGLIACEELGFSKNGAVKKFYCTTALGKQFLDSYFRMQKFYCNTLMVRS
jgi:predicted transcriptional regulator